MSVSLCLSIVCLLSFHCYNVRSHSQHSVCSLSSEEVLVFPPEQRIRQTVPETHVANAADSKDLQCTIVDPCVLCPSATLPPLPPNYCCLWDLTITESLADPRGADWFLAQNPLLLGVVKQATKVIQAEGALNFLEFLLLYI